MNRRELRAQVGDEPSAARIYDYNLGGHHNFEADRRAAEHIRALVPHAPYVAQANRAFLRRAVRYMVASGVHQFVDLGSGIPTVGNVHEIAQRTAPDARVVYVEDDPVAVAHTRRMLEGVRHAAVLDADLRCAEKVLASEPVQRSLRWDRPIGLLIIAALHYIPDSDGPTEVLRAYTEALPEGSMLALSQVTADNWPEDAEKLNQFVYESTGASITPRSHDEITRIVDDAGWELVSPGLVHPPEWKPDGSDPGIYPVAKSGSWAGVAIRRPLEG